MEGVAARCRGWHEIELPQVSQVHLSALRFILCSLVKSYLGVEFDGALAAS
jgi:hypothetical protein